jgi:hypothetical protein
LWFLFARGARPVTRRGRWQSFECLPAWNGNWTWDCFPAFAWGGAGGGRLLVAVNGASDQRQCYVRLPFPDPQGGSWRLEDLLGDAVYDPPGGDLHSRELYPDVSPWGLRLFHKTGTLRLADSRSRP